jgi:DNA-binding GntR family transcriptional regulator
MLQLASAVPARKAPAKGRAAGADPRPGFTIEHPPTLVDLIEERLRHAIVTAELRFGQALSEGELALGVSRTPLREALTRLELQGLVHIVPKRGTFVFKPTVTDATELATFRLILETSALELSFVHDREGTLAALRGELQHMKAALKTGDTLAYALADSRFHEAFFAHCGNAYIVNAFRNVSGRISALRAHLTVPRPQEQSRSLAEHEAIVEAFATGAKKDIRKTLSDHILRAKDVYAQAILEDAEAPETPAS